MYLLYCDETNLEAKSGDFFVYGGICVPDNQAEALSVRIDELRKKAGIDPSFPLKFNPGPAHLTHQQFIDVKVHTIQAAIEHGAVAFASVILHNVAKSPDEARRNEINRVCYHFNCFLNREQCPGLVLIDRFSDSQIDTHLIEKFSVGVTGLPYTSELRLQHILGFHYSAIGQSHFPSITDIVLGSLRFAVNAHTQKHAQHEQTARTLIGLLSPLFFREHHHASVSEIGFFYSPKTVRVPRYRQIYLALQRFLRSAGMPTSQDLGGS